MLRCTLYQQGPMNGWQLGDAECELRTDLVLISRSLFVLRRGIHHSCVGALRHIQSAVVAWRLPRASRPNAKPTQVPALRLGVDVLFSIAPGVFRGSCTNEDPFKVGTVPRPRTSVIPWREPNPSTGYSYSQGPILHETPGQSLQRDLKKKMPDAVCDITMNVTIGSTGTRI